MLSWALERIPFASPLLGSVVSDPMRYVAGKPLERWLMLIDLPLRKVALANDPRVVETVMLDRAGVFPKSSVVEQLLRPLIRGGVFGQPGGAAVKETRRIFSRSLAALPDGLVADIAARITDEYVARWRAQPGLRLAVSEEMSRLTVDIVSEATLGGRFTPDESHRFARLFFTFNEKARPLVLLLTSSSPRVRARLIAEMGLDRIGSEMRHLMRERFVHPLLGVRNIAELPPFARALAEAGRFDLADPDVEGLLDEIAVMLLAGHETTASTLAWLAWELARRPELQDRLSDLVRSGRPDPAFWNGAEPEAVLDALGKETLRLYPPIGFFLRETQADAMFREKQVPAGSYVIVSPWTLHRHRRFWREPDSFQPERWLSDDPPPPRTSYMPFGLGARSCPGARFAAVEMNAILHGLLSGVRLNVPPGAAQPRPLGNLTSRPLPEIVLAANPRPAE